MIFCVRDDWCGKPNEYNWEEVFIFFFRCSMEPWKSIFLFWRAVHVPEVVSILCSRGKNLSYFSTNNLLCLQWAMHSTAHLTYLCKSPSWMHWKDFLNLLNLIFKIIFYQKAECVMLLHLCWSLYTNHKNTFNSFTLIVDEDKWFLAPISSIRLYFIFFFRE